MARQKLHPPCIANCESLSFGFSLCEWERTCFSEISTVWKEKARRWTPSNKKKILFGHLETFILPVFSRAFQTHYTGFSVGQYCGRFLWPRRRQADERALFSTSFYVRLTEEAADRSLAEGLLNLRFILLKEILSWQSSSIVMHILAKNWSSFVYLSATFATVQLVVTDAKVKQIMVKRRISFVFLMYHIAIRL